MTRAICILLTTLTGFAGLAYEVTWQRYLAALLGAHSEATAAVLAIFLGGLSFGYWGFGVLTREWVRRERVARHKVHLLVLYGLVEAAVGLYALSFPWIFRLAQHVSLWLPGGSGAFGFVADVVLSAAVIAPPAILMGATIPVLTQALARDIADATRLHALVYASNTAGAFVGALAAGFVLVPQLGLDGVARAMGAINLAAGAAFVLLGSRTRVSAPEDAAPAEPVIRVAGGQSHHAAAAFLIGFAGITTQTVAIRLGALSFGPSEFTFGMVVAVYVLAIAIGSLVVSLANRIGRAALPAVLWSLAGSFTLLYLFADEAPYWAHVLRTKFASSEENFLVFYAAAFAAVLTVIGVPVAFAGAALPLIFDAAREEVGDLGAVAGRLYGLNTVGALFGALLGGYALLFWLDLHHVYRIALIAFMLAAALVTAPRFSERFVATVAALFAPAALAVVFFPAWDPGRLSSGLYRVREVKPAMYAGAGPAHRAVAFHDDDPTASVVALVRNDASVSIVVNGKPDGNTRADLNTMALASLIPALLAERAEQAFVIGFGTGITAGYLANLDDVRKVTVAEISSGVLGAAPLFDSANNGASSHPKIERVRSDAYRALMRSDEKFDVIVSEPSNAWVAGVEMLYTVEFLRAAREHLAPGGVYVQWYHIYENNNRSVQLVLQAYCEVFGRVAVWRPQSTDLLLVGFRDEQPIDLARLEARAARPDFQAALNKVGIDELPELLVHESVPVGAVDAGIRKLLPNHTLFHPRLSYEAVRGFFVGRQARLPFLGSGEAGRIGRENSLLGQYLRRLGGAPPESVWASMIHRACRFNLPQCSTLIAAWDVRHGDRADRGQRLADWGVRPGTIGLERVPLLRFFYGAPGTGVAGGPPEVIARQMGIFMDSYLPALPFQPASLVELWRRCVDERDTRCRDGLSNASDYAASGEFPPSWLRYLAVE